MSFVKVTPTISNIKKHLSLYGVLGWAIDASDGLWQTYAGGILNQEPLTERNHAINLVGYGSSNDVDYWIIRNSWGSDWGEDGYIRLNQNTSLNALDPNYIHAVTDCTITSEMVNGQFIWIVTRDMSGNP